MQVELLSKSIVNFMIDFDVLLVVIALDVIASGSQLIINIKCHNFNKHRKTCETLLIILLLATFT